MRIRILEKNAKELKFEIEGEGHTICNQLEDTILEDEKVEISGYNIKHPLTSKPIVYIRTKGRTKPETALKNAIEKILTRERTFKIEFTKAIKEWQDSKKQT